MNISSLSKNHYAWPTFSSNPWYSCFNFCLSVCCWLINLQILKTVKCHLGGHRATLPVSPMLADLCLSWSHPGFLPCFGFKVPMMRRLVRLHLMYQVSHTGNGHPWRRSNCSICLPCHRYSSWCTQSCLSSYFIHNPCSYTTRFM